VITFLNCAKSLQIGLNYLESFYKIIKLLIYKWIGYFFALWESFWKKFFGFFNRLCI